MAGQAGRRSGLCTARLRRLPVDAPGPEPLVEGVLSQRAPGGAVVPAACSGGSERDGACTRGIQPIERLRSLRKRRNAVSERRRFAIPSFHIPRPDPQPIPNRQSPTGSLVIAMRIHISANDWVASYPGFYSYNLTIGQEEALSDHIWLKTIGDSLLEWFYELQDWGWESLLLRFSRRSRSSASTSGSSCCF